MHQAAGTILSRVFITMMSLLVTMIAGHRLGAEGLGDISLIVLGITLIMLPVNVVGGGGLVYFASRAKLARLLRPAYGWAVIITLASYDFLLLIPLVPDRYLVAVVMLAALQSLYTIHLNILLGRERIRAYNLITTAQALALFVFFLFFSSRSGPHTAHDYVLASMSSFALTVVLSGIALSGLRNAKYAAPIDRVLSRLARQGGMIQGANALQLLNYRLGYWLIEHFRGSAALGVFSVATQLAEGSWLAPRSLGTVLYSKVSNTQEPARQRDLTLTTFKASVAFALAVVLLVLAIPDAWIRALFGPEITGLAPIVSLLAPGIVAMAASQAFSHYFSGTAANRHNLIGSGLGLAITCLAGLVLIPRYGLEGAAGAASLAYCANAVYQAILFLRITGARSSELLPHAGDVQRVRSLLRSIRP